MPLPTKAQKNIRDLLETESTVRTALKEAETQTVAPIIPGARLPVDPERVADLAGLGMELDMIALRVGMTPRAFKDLCQRSPELRYAIANGIAARAEQIMRAVVNNAATGDTNAGKLYLERVIGGKWSRPTAVAENAPQKPVLDASLIYDGDAEQKRIQEAARSGVLNMPEMD